MQEDTSDSCRYEKTDEQELQAGHAVLKQGTGFQRSEMNQRD